MPSPMRQVWNNLAERFDEELFPTLYAAASLSTADIRSELDTLGLARLGADTSPAPHELELASRAVIARSCRRAAARGGALTSGAAVDLCEDECLGADPAHRERAPERRQARGAQLRLEAP